jgi:hypothetical protein
MSDVMVETINKIWVRALGLADASRAAASNRRSGSEYG